MVLDAPANLSCAVRAGEPGDEVQGPVDPSGNSGGRHHVAVVDEAFATAHVDGWIKLGERIASCSRTEWLPRQVAACAVVAHTAGGCAAENGAPCGQHQNLAVPEATEDGDDAPETP